MSTFSAQSGNLSYRMRFVPQNTVGSFSLALISGGTDNEANSLRFGSLIQAVTGKDYISYALDTTYQYIAAGNPQSGEVGIYYQRIQPSGWTKIETLTGYQYSGGAPSGVGFGEVVEIDNDVLAVGIPDATVGEISGRGAIGVFNSWQLNNSGGATGNQWGQTYLLTGEPNSGGKLGSSLSVIENSLIAGGSPHENSGSGAVYLYNATTAAFRKKIISPEGNISGYFGSQVQLLTGEGIKALAVSSYSNVKTGKVYIFQQNNVGSQNWGHSQSITAPSPQSGDLFGSSLTAGGNTLVVGSPYYDTDTKSGAAYVYNFSQASNAWELDSRLAPSNLAAHDEFGKNVKLGKSKLLVGSNHSSGSVYLFEKSGSWSLLKQFTGSGALVSGSFGGSVDGPNNISLEDENIIIGTAADDKFYYFTTGTQTGSGEKVLVFSGISGKLFDNDLNYVFSYNSGVTVGISGNVFTGYHNYFINDILVNSNCSKNNYPINSYSVGGTGHLVNFGIDINAP